jgi:hypothetical protein
MGASPFSSDMRHSLHGRVSLLLKYETRVLWSPMRGWFPIFCEVEVGRLVEISTLVKKAPNERS